jgi:mannose-6-phosphate isomerase-like protein (cupin superfamily)
MNIFPIERLARELESVEIYTETDAQTAMRCMRMIGSINGSAMGIVSFSGQTGWECHPGGDEMLCYLEGEAEISLITDDGDVRRTVKKGDVVQIPTGLWHSQRTLTPVRLFFITPAHNTKHSRVKPSTAATI